jgi:hypothetical protein
MVLELYAIATFHYKIHADKILFFDLFVKNLSFYVKENWSPSDCNP